MNNKELIAEGITKQFLTSFSMQNNCSPVQLRPNEEPINLLACSKGYWVCLEFGKFLKDDNGNMIVIPEKEAKIGRARYMFQFADKIASDKLSNAIEKEYTNLKNKVEKRVEAMIYEMKKLLIRADKIGYKGLDRLFLSMEEQGNGFESEWEKEQRKEIIAKKKEHAVEVTTQEFQDTYNGLCRLWEEKDYDTLYIWLFQDGMPLLGSFKFDNSGDMKVGKEMFDFNHFEATANKIKDKGHLYIVAEVNARKMIEKGK